MKLRFDYVAFLILIAASFIFSVFKILFPRNVESPAWEFPGMDRLEVKSIKTKTTGYPKAFFIAAFAFFAAAFLDPRIVTENPPIGKPGVSSDARQTTTEGIAVYLVLDRSGSMGKPVTITVNGSLKTISKMEMLKKVTEKFIEKHPDDLIGLIEFARIPRVLVPLTSDRKLLVEKLNEIRVVDRPEEDGTAIGYAILKAIRLISATRYFAEEMRKSKLPPYEIKGAIAVVVTDGFQDPNRLDAENRMRTIELEEVSDDARNEKIRLYVIDIDPEFALSADYAPHRRQLKKITEKTGGAFYSIENLENADTMYAGIDAAEKGKIRRKGVGSDAGKVSESVRSVLYPYFIVFGLICLSIAVVFDSIVLRRVP